MLYIIPDYYKKFSCTANECEDTCCAGWQIVIDEKSLEKYKKVQGTFMFRMLRSIKWKQKVFRQDKEKRCAFLNCENLCDMYRTLGEKSLCKTCRLYPRHIEEFEGVREITLSLSCPEVARILMECIEPVKFLSYDKPEIEEKEDFEDFDLFFYSMLGDARDQMLEILQNRDISIKERAILVLGMAHDMQRRINNEEMFECFSVIEKYSTQKALDFVADYVKKSETLYAPRQLFQMLYDLEVLREEWEMLLQETEAILYANGTSHYDNIRLEYENWKLEHADVDIHIEQILVYFLFTYFAGAVYDGEVFAKTQMAVYCTAMIEELWMARWFLNGKSLEKEEMTELLYRFSREVEHSDENLMRVEKWMKSPRLIG